ncbi:hypothetical protein DMC47_37030 [Nostoc sp. 3335mG]|nr:hypothetical protein DMC47_37030 [Nostoc sp. 3335mG]
MSMMGMSMMGDGQSSAGSGTSRLPANDTMPGLHFMAGDWMLMAHGYAWGSWTDQGGPRGAKEAFVQSMAMLEASRPIGAGVDLTLRSMLSADPLMGKRGYPDLFATGETAHGLALIDRQHPHDLFMEMSGRIDIKTGEDRRLFVYAGLPGEPALGPSAFMHRGSARFDPEAPITHHWFDSTHITWGVVTAGYATRSWQIETSAFKGREPDEDRYNIETPKLDSWSVRATWNPSPEWSAEVSYGQLHSPEVLHPEQNERRLIASASYSAHGLDVTAAYSRKAATGDRVLPAWLLEGTWAITRRHAVFGRFENVLNDELFEREEQLGISEPLIGEPFRVSKFTAGYAYTLPLGKSLAVALGAAASAYAKSDRLDEAYGRNPHSLTIFAKLMLGR